MNLNNALTTLTSIVGPNLKVSRVNESLTNATYLLESKSNMWSLRLNNPDSVNLGINREIESEILSFIKNNLWSPKVAYCDSNMLLTQWQPGQPFKAESNKNLISLLQIFKDLHELKDIPNKINSRPLIISKQINYLLGRITIPLSPLTLNLIKSKTQQYREPNKLCLCHNDLHPGNIIVNSGFYSILDWEYASLGDPLVDIACAIEGFNLNDYQVTRLIDSADCTIDQLNLVRCLTQIMALLWFQVRFPSLDYSKKMSEWTTQWKD